MHDIVHKHKKLSNKGTIYKKHSQHFIPQLTSRLLRGKISQLDFQ